MKRLIALLLFAPVAMAANAPDGPGSCTVTIQYHPSNPQHVSFRIAGDKTCDAKTLKAALSHLVANF
jgi:hypothetical protein